MLCKYNVKWKQKQISFNKMIKLTSSIKSMIVVASTLSNNFLREWGWGESL